MTSIILTGAPGVGKTTIVMDVAQKLKARGVIVGGVVSREIRTNNVRIGFEFIDLLQMIEMFWLLSPKMVRESENTLLT